MDTIFFKVGEPMSFYMFVTSELTENMVGVQISEKETTDVSTQTHS